MNGQTCQWFVFSPKHNKLNSIFSQLLLDTMLLCGAVSSEGCSVILGKSSEGLKWIFFYPQSFDWADDSEMMLLKSISSMILWFKWFRIWLIIGLESNITKCVWSSWNWIGNKKKITLSLDAMQLIPIVAFAKCWCSWLNLPNLFPTTVIQGHRGVKG